MEENSNGINFEKFYKASLNYLSFRPRSEKEIRDYLKRKTQNVKPQIDEKIIERIIESLKKSKFIDDEEFARRFIEQRIKIKHKAWRIIKFELRQKGISSELIDNIQNSENSEDAVSNNDFKSALELAERKMPRFAKIQDKRKIYEKLGRYLASKGFDWDTVKAVIDRVLNN
jgi:regulatory protein